MKENYQPSQEEITKAEDMLTPKEKEMSQKREHNFEFSNEFSSFGIKDQEMIDKLMQYGKISEIKAADDLLEIYYQTGKYKKIAVRKSEVKNIDPQTDEVVDSKMHFKVDLSPEKQYVGKTSGKKPSQESYEQDNGMWG